MRNKVILKLNYFRRKTQALSELAIFGTILLMVFGFMIRMGMLYMNRQDINMRAFRKAMSLAIQNDKPSASAGVVLVEDKHIPDPRDIVGTGDITAAQGTANVVWGNTLPYYTPAPKTYTYEQPGDLATVHFEVNGIIKEYKIEGYGETVPNGSDVPVCIDCSASPFWVYSQKYGWQLISQSDTRVVDPEFDPRAIYMENNITDTVTKIRLNGSKDILNVLYVQPQADPNEYQVACFFVLNPANGDINLSYLSLNNDLDEDGLPDVTPDTMHGLIPGTTILTRTDSVVLNQAGAAKTSITKQKISGTIEHRVRTNKGEDNFDYTVDIDRTIAW